MPEDVENSAKLGQKLCENVVENDREIYRRCGILIAAPICMSISERRRKDDFGARVGNLEQQLSGQLDDTKK